MPPALGHSDEKTSRVDVRPGLYVLRYVSSVEPADLAPTAFVVPTTRSERILQIISAPGHTKGYLSAPGKALVILADSAGEIEISVRKRSYAGSLNASFELEPINDTASDARPHTSDPAVLQDGFSFLVHMARRGDVEIEDGQWAGGPQSPTPIEGLEIRCGLRHLDLEAQVLVDNEWSPWRPSLNFMGSRGRALPLTGLRFRLTGPEGARYAVDVEALFLGSPVLSRRGSSVELVSYATSDPLVGLKIKIMEIRSERSFDSTSQGESKGSKVRVFRAVS